MPTIRATATAFIAGKPAKCHNARTDGQTYTLHKTIIARKTDAGLTLNWGGWHTPTTANHLNAILDAAGARFRVSYAQARDGCVTLVDVAVPRT